MPKLDKPVLPSHTAGGAFFLALIFFLLVMVLDHTAPRPEIQYLLGFAAAAVFATLLTWWLSAHASRNAGVAFYLSVFAFLVALVLDHTSPQPQTGYLLAFTAAATIGTLMTWCLFTKRTPWFSRR